MDAAQLKQVEALCDIMLAPAATPDQKKHASAALTTLGSSAKYIPQCQFILDSSNNQYALYIACTNLTKLISEHWNNFSEEQRVDIRNYVLTYLARKGASLESYVITALIQMLCRITKLGWFDSSGALRKIVEQATTFLQESVQHCIIGLRLLNELVMEFNHVSAQRTVSAHRKVAVSFRDLSLFYVFEISLTMLQQIIQGSMGVSDPALEDQVLQNALQLVINCLQYDFIGTNPDESAEDVGTIQLPLKWRPKVEDPNTMKIFFDMYRGCSRGTFTPKSGGASAGAAAGSHDMVGAGGGMDLGMGASAMAMAGAGAGAGAGAAAGTGATRGSIPVRPKRAAQALECLTLFISVRRSIFAKEETRVRFLLQIVGGVCEVMRDEIGLADGQCYHQFCRLLGKLKATYQLSDLVRTTGYPEWISLACDFAIKSFRQMHVVANSIHYILGLWSRLVSAAPHVSPDVLAHQSPMLATYAPQVAFGYLEARLGMVEAVVAGSISDDLQDEDLVLQQLEQLPIICRYKYSLLAKQVLGILDPLLNRLNEGLSLLHTSHDATVAAKITVIEVKLAWIVYYIGAIIGGQGYRRLVRSGDVGSELVDADLCRRVLQLMQAMDMRLSSTRGASKSDSRLELAMLFFVGNLRKSYIGEQHGMPTPGRESQAPVSSKQKTFAAMFERMGLGDHLTVVSTLVQKMANNLRYWTEDIRVISATLTLFTELAWTYSSVKLLLTLDAVKHILTHHTEEHFPFLKPVDNTRHRTTFYTALARLLFMSESTEAFAQFMEPINHVLTALKTTVHVRSEKVMHGLIGVCRDLRGIVAATNSRRTYALVFDALFPAHFDLFSKAIMAWADTPAVTSIVLKLVCELATNKGDRIMFGNMSPNGILLFREISKVICAYAARIINTNPTSDEYDKKYKGISICLQVMSLALVGGYVQFGVFELYGDTALDAAMEACVRMALCVPLAKVLAHPKVARNYFGFVDCVCRSYIKAIVALEPPVFLGIVKSIQEGLDSIDSSIALHAANSIDSIASYFVRNIRKSKPAAQALRALITANPTVFPTFTTVLFNILVFGECKNQWALARPLLSLLLAGELQRKDSFAHFKESFIASQPAEFRPRLEEAFEALMKDVNTTLDLTNRERFTQHLSTFRNTVRSFIKY